MPAIVVTAVRAKMDNRMNDIKEKQQQAKPIYILDKENNKLEELRACSFTKLNLTPVFVTFLV